MLYKCNNIYQARYARRIGQTLVCMEPPLQNKKSYIIFFQFSRYIIAYLVIILLLGIIWFYVFFFFVPRNRATRNIFIQQVFPFVGLLS